MESFLVAAFVTFFASWFVVPIGLWFVQFLGLYTIVEERRCHVYILFGEVIGILNEPGLYILPSVLGPKALLVSWLGRCEVVDLRVDQEYLRSQAVNSEEGAPMGIGIWYEMFISDPVAYLFRNADPRGSLRANVSNATVRCLSNMKLADMLETRHTMSQMVRTEVSAKSQDWGYKLGSTYIRKVHFRDRDMIRQIEDKVVNRLRQVTGAIKQDGANQVSIIASTAERQSAIEFAKAAAVRPRVVGMALQKIYEDQEVGEALFDILETQRLVESSAQIFLVPPSEGAALLPSLLVSDDADEAPTTRLALPASGISGPAAAPATSSAPAPAPSGERPSRRRGGAAR